MSSHVLIRAARPSLSALTSCSRLSLQLARRNLFYVQRKRPATADENLAFVTGLGLLGGAISLVRDISSFYICQCSVLVCICTY